MKFPSLKSLADSFTATLKRFPFEVLFALTGTIAETVYIQKYTYEENSFFSKLLMTANLGLLLSLATTLYTASKGTGKRLLIRLVVAIFAGSLFFVFNPQLRGIDYTRFFLLSLAFHLLVAFAAFTGKGHINGFWQFNKTLFLRFLASMLYSGVLCLGLDAALAASNFLFNLHLEYKVYMTLFTWIAGVFNTIFFLSGVPENTAALDEDTSYPKGLKVFTQYVLIPLASVYVLILLAYEGKILVLWSLPKGFVSNLILGYAVFGILSILLIYPLRNQDGNKWIKTYVRNFYFLLIPLLVLLVLAIVSRVMPYGITASRYFLMVLAGWLLFITVYFLLSRKQNIKVIPMSLFALALFAAYGPQSAFSVAAYSQRRILANIFKKYGAYHDGKLTSLAKAKADSADGFKAVDKVTYFVYENDLRGLQPCIAKDLDKVIDSITHIRDTTVSEGYHVRLVIGKGKKATFIDEYEVKSREQDWMKTYLGLNGYDHSYDYTNYSYAFNARNKLLLTTSGYDYALGFDNMISDTGSTVVLKNANLKIKQTVSADRIYTLVINKDKVSFDVKAIADSLLKKRGDFKGYGYPDTDNLHATIFNLPNELLSFTKQTANYKITCQFERVTFSYAGPKGKIDVRKIDNANFGIDGSYLIKVLK